MFSFRLPTVKRYVVRTIATTAVETSMIKRKAPPVMRPVYLQLSSLVHESPEEAEMVEGNYAVLNPTVFGHPIRQDILHLCIVQYLDGLRQGSASTKNRSEVNYSTRKIRRQKGTGKARLGERGSPMLVGGGRAHGPKPRDFSTKLPKKVKDMGMRAGLSLKVKDRRLGIVPSLEWPGIKTKHLYTRLQELGWTKSTLFVTGHSAYLTEESPVAKLEKASRNIEKVEVIHAEELLLFDLLKWQRVVMDTDAVRWFERRYRKEWIPQNSSADDITGYQVNLKSLLPSSIDHAEDHATAEEESYARDEIVNSLMNEALRIMGTEGIKKTPLQEQFDGLLGMHSPLQFGELKGGLIRRPVRNVLHARL